MCSNHVQSVKVRISYGISYMKCINIQYLTSTEYTHCSGHSNRTVSTLTLPHAPFPSGLWWLETWFCRLICHIWPFHKNVIIIISSRQTFCCHAVTNYVWVPVCLQHALTFDTTVCYRSCASADREYLHNDTKKIKKQQKCHLATEGMAGILFSFTAIDPVKSCMRGMKESTQFPPCMETVAKVLRHSMLSQELLPFPGSQSFLSGQSWSGRIIAAKGTPLVMIGQPVSNE